MTWLTWRPTSLQLNRPARYPQGRHQTPDIHTGAPAQVRRVRVRAWKRVVEDGTRGATAFGGEEGWPVAPRNCQLTFLPPCKKTRSYVPVYVATAHEPHDELARQGSTDPGRGPRRGTRLATARVTSLEREREKEEYVSLRLWAQWIANRSTMNLCCS